MKHTIFFFALLFCAVGLNAQSVGKQTPAQETTAALTARYQLTTDQQAEVLELQERKYRNLAEIESLRDTEPQTYAKKIRAMQYAQDMAMRKLLDEPQLKIFQQQLLDLRQRRAEVYKEMKAAGKHPVEIESKVVEIETAALLQN